MTSQHPDWEKLWKRIQYLLQHNPAWLRKNINRRVKQIVSSAHVKQQQTFKYLDWGETWHKVKYKGDQSWLRNHIKSHDLNQCRNKYGDTLLHRAIQYNDKDVIYRLSNLLIDPNLKNANGDTALELARCIKAYCLKDLQKKHLCIDFSKASTEPNGLDALFAAIYRGAVTLGDTSGVKDDGNEVNEGGWTALHCAVMYDHPHLIRALHRRFPKLDANYSNSDNYSALRLAAMHGHSNCIIALCKCFPAIDVGDALQAACEYNLSACIPTLRKCFTHLTGNELIDNHNYSSALMCAALHNNPECIRTLHSYFPDIDPNLQDNDGNTALIVAMRYPGSPESIPVLSECFPDIDPNKQDNNGDTALMHACTQGLPQSITLLATYFPSIDVNMRNKEGNTALILATERNHDEKCIVALYESFPNIDPHIQNLDGETALMVTALKYNPEPIISQLVKFFPDIDPNVQDKFGQTALMVAQLRDPRIISLNSKVFPNIDPNKQDQDQYTALMYLLQFRFCSVESVRQFLDTFPNVDVNIQNAQSETALTLAIQKNDDSIVALLLERFPDISYINSTGPTALMLVIEKHDTNLISMLLNHISQID